MKNTMKNEMSTEQMNQVTGGTKPRSAMSAVENEFYGLPDELTGKTLPKYMSAAADVFEAVTGKTLPKTLPRYMSAAQNEFYSVTRYPVV